MNKLLTINDSINIGKNKKVPVSELIDSHKIFSLIKEGYQFDDEVLEKAHIKKTIRDVRIISDRVGFVKQKEKKLPKETENIKNIIKSFNTIENQITQNVNNIDEGFHLQDELYDIIDEND